MEFLLLGDSRRNSPFEYNLEAAVGKIPEAARRESDLPISECGPEIQDHGTISPETKELGSTISLHCQHKQRLPVGTTAALTLIT